MIKHYAIVTAVFPNYHKGGDPIYEIDHSMLLNTFGGVAQDMSTGKWLTPSQLGSEEDQDSEFLMMLSRSMAQAVNH